MPVNTPHPDFTAHRAAWRKQRTFKEGGDAVKAAGEDFLPRLSDDNDQDYKEYRDRALFYGATGRTLQALAGSVFRKEPIVEFPGDVAVLDKCGKGGETCLELIKRTIEDQLLPGRIGALVDAPATPNADPYIVTYSAENIVSWATASVSGFDRMVEVVLCEETERRDPSDRFMVRRGKRYRVLRLGSLPDEDGKEQPVDYDNPESLLYYQELWAEQESSDGDGRPDTGTTQTYVLQEVLVPTAWGGRTLNYIPFVCFGSKSLNVKPEPGPMLELVNVNLSHYVSSADLEHGRHFTALPTPVLAGFNPDFRLKIGSGVAWISENPSAHAFFLEFSGAGLGHLVEGQKHKEHLMATLGARLLEEPKGGVESADALRLRALGEHSALANVVVVGSMGWTMLLGYLAEWRGLPAGARAEINKDFDLSKLDPASMQNFMLQVQGGMMSYETYFYNLKKGEVYPEGWTIEDEKAAIEAGLPAAPPSPAEERELELAETQAQADADGAEDVDEEDEEDEEEPEPEEQLEEEPEPEE